MYDTNITFNLISASWLSKNICKPKPHIQFDCEVKNYIPFSKRNRLIFIEFYCNYAKIISQKID